MNNRGAVTNCGRCRKCLTSMIGLKLAGALERCPTFAQPLDLDAVKQMDLMQVFGRTYNTENLVEVLEEQGREPELAQALSVALDRVQTQMVERMEREIARREAVLASTQAWARELEAAAIVRDRDRGRIERLFPFQLARRVRRIWPRE